MIGYALHLKHSIDLDQIWDFVAADNMAADNIDAADRLLKAIEEAIKCPVAHRAQARRFDFPPSSFLAGL
jgi:hypothetical protein